MIEEDMIQTTEFLALLALPLGFALLAQYPGPLSLVSVLTLEVLALMIVVLTIMVVNRRKEPS